MVKGPRKVSGTSQVNATTEHVLQALANLPAQQQLAIVVRTLLALRHSVRPRRSLAGGCPHADRSACRHAGC